MVPYTCVDVTGVRGFRRTKSDASAASAKIGSAWDANLFGTVPVWISGRASRESHRAFVIVHRPSAESPRARNASRRPDKSATLRRHLPRWWSPGPARFRCCHRDQRRAASGCARFAERGPRAICPATTAIAPLELMVIGTDLRLVRRRARDRAGASSDRGHDALQVAGQRGQWSPCRCRRGRSQRRRSAGR